MSVGTQRFDIPSIEDILAQLEALNVTPDLLDAISNYAVLIGLQRQLGELGLQSSQQGLQQAQIDADMAELDFNRDYLLPFRREELENDRILAQLGIEGRNIDLQSQRELADIRRREGEQQLQQIREIGEFDAFQNEIARKTALIHLARQREELAAIQTDRRRGRGQFTPRGIA